MGFGFFRFRSTQEKVLGFLDFWVSREREVDRGWNRLFNVSVDQGRKKSVGCFSVFFILFIYLLSDMEAELEERRGQFGYKLTTKLRVHESHIIFGIRIVILKRSKVGFPISYIFHITNPKHKFP